MKPIKYIRGNNYKANEIKDSFLKLGAHNAKGFEFSNEQLVYYLDNNNYVDSYNINKPLAKLLLEHGEEIELPEKNELPKTWEEWVEMNPEVKGEFYIDSMAKVCNHQYSERLTKRDCSNLSSFEDAVGLLALIKLKRLRDCYNDGWKPDWEDGETKFCIEFSENKIVSTKHITDNTFLAFRTEELSNEFLNNFKELIETAKMWL